MFLRPRSAGRGEFRLRAVWQTRATAHGDPAQSARRRPETARPFAADARGAAVDRPKQTRGRRRAGRFARVLRQLSKVPQPAAAFAIAAAASCGAVPRSRRRSVRSGAARPGRRADRRQKLAAARAIVRCQSLDQSPACGTSPGRDRFSLNRLRAGQALGSQRHAWSYRSGFTDELGGHPAVSQLGVRGGGKHARQLAAEPLLPARLASVNPLGHARARLLQVVCRGNGRLGEPSYEGPRRIRFAGRMAGLSL